VRLAIISDIHYASAAEQARRDYPYASIAHPLRRFWTRQHRHWIWQRDPFAHNHLLDRFLAETAHADFAVANGDYSCDSAAIGVADDAALDSARQCLVKLRQTFGAKLRATIGDHEIGKRMMSAEIGGLRLASYHRAQTELGLEPFWRHDLGRYVLLGITSPLVAFPIYESEALPAERAEWAQLRGAQLAAIREAFAGLRATQRVLLFCHDPSALPFLWRDEVVRSKLPQIERTLIGHLHSNAVFCVSRWLAGMPAIGFLGHTPRRLSAALREARHWAPFKPLLCPSPAGTQLLKDGGYLVAELDAKGDAPVRFTLRRLKW
jgi:3',5'-cyclic AMP phosphodiesterase CpdA